jgi:hypothetical protein
LASAGNGLLAKTNSTTLAARTISVSGGLSVTDGDGVGGNPTIATTGLLNALAATSGTGLLATAGGATLTPITITGVANQIAVTAGNTLPVIGLADDAVMPGTGAMTIPVGTTAQLPIASNVGMIRYDTTQGAFYGYSGIGWNQFSLAGGVTQVNTGTGLTGGPITSVGTISLADTAVTAAAYGSATQVGTFTVNAQGQLTLAGNTTVTPAVGSITGLGTNVATALGVAVGTAGSFVVNGGALGTPSSGTVTNLTGTASININGTVGATTPTTGNFTTVTATTGIFGGTF